MTGNSNFTLDKMDADGYGEGMENSVQFYIAKWDDPRRFAIDFRICEGIYGRVPSDLDIDRAYARYVKKAVA